MKCRVIITLILMMILLGEPTVAQGPPDPGGPPTNGTPRLGGGAPIGSGTLLLIALGVVYGVGKTRIRVRQSVKDQPLAEYL
jgi:hypothetical protein